MSRFLTIIAAALTVWLGLAASAFAATPLVDTGWLDRNLDNAQVRIIDMRNRIDGGNNEIWQHGHIPGSVHSDYLLESWRVGSGWRVSRDGVVGLLPTEDQFSAIARKLGISNDTHVVIVPAGVSSSDFGSSARAYWTFKVFGHDNVSILDGGYKAWQTAFPGKIEKGEGAVYAPGNFNARFNETHYIAATDVVPLVGNSDNATLLDARTPDQFDGLAKHPRAKAPGRIPGALGIFQDVSFDAKTGRLKPKDELARLYAQVDSSKPVVSYCNTGHWAAVNWFVLSEVLGHENVKLYDGSMVEWTTDSERPVQGPTNFGRIRGFFRDLLS